MMFDTMIFHFKPVSDIVATKQSKITIYKNLYIIPVPKQGHIE